MERIVMDEGPHRPILRDNFAGQLDVGPELHPLSIVEFLRLLHLHRHRRSSLVCRFHPTTPKHYLTRPHPEPAKTGSLPVTRFFPSSPIHSEAPDAHTFRDS